MANVNLKTATPDTTVPTGAVIFGADSQSAAAPSVYPLSKLSVAVAAAIFGGATVLYSAQSPAVDGTTDDSAALQAAHDALPAEGGTILMDVEGVTKITSSINITKPNVKIRGFGHRNASFATNWLSNPNGPCIIYSYHNAAAFLFDMGVIAADGTSGFEISDISLIGDRTTYTSCTAFNWTGTTADFDRNFIFERCAVVLFACAFQVDGSGGGTAAGVVRIQNCNIMYNAFIAKTTGGATFNGFVFRDNDAGQNGYSSGEGGIAITGFGVNIAGNVLEGQRDPIKLTGACRGVEIGGNYFESNVGTACIQIQDGSEFTINNNTYISLSTDYKVLLSYCGQGTCHDPYIAIGAFKVNESLGIAAGGRDITVPASTANPVPHWCIVRPKWGGLLSVDGIHTPNYDQARYVAARRIPVQRHSIPASNSGLVTASVTASGSSGQWAVVQFMVCLNDDTPADDPYLILNINNAAAAGTYESPLSNWHTYVKTGETMMIVAAIRLHAAMTAMGVYFYPYGINPANGSTITFDKSQIQLAVVDDINDIAQGMNDIRARAVSAAPTYGTWVATDEVFKSAPAADNTRGWACGTGGTPGTWYVA